MNHQPCSVCGGPTVPREHGGTAFRDCRRCGYGRIAVPTLPKDYWPDDLTSKEIPDFWIAAKRSYFLSALKLLERKSPGRRLLDFGGGVGYFCELALNAGWDAYSLDISPEASVAAAARLGADRVFEDPADVERGSFDVVTMWCVVAHVTNPVDLLEQARRPLSTGGILWLTTPNYRFQKPYSAIRKLMGRPIDFAAEDHIGQFTPEALASLLEHHGFGEPQHHFVGVTERCIGSRSDAQAAVSAKRAYNRVAHGLARTKLPTFVSELQVTSVLLQP